MHQIAVWLVNAQWIGAAKTEDGEGRPNGPYGEVYAARRARTMETHSDWTPGHRRMDALRITMKSFLLDLWLVWNGKEAKTSKSVSTDHNADDTQRRIVGRAAGQSVHDAQSRIARRTSSKKTTDHNKGDAQYRTVG